MNNPESGSVDIIGSTDNPNGNGNEYITIKQKYKNLAGNRFGKLLVLSILRTGYNGYKIWDCVCDCGKTVSVRSSRLLGGHTKSCGCLRNETSYKKTGVGDLSGEHLNDIKSSARKRKIEYSISKEYLWELYLKQDGKCALTGLSISLVKSETEPRTASLDRIDSSTGYIRGNVWWVHKDINNIKQGFSVEELKRYCHLILEYKRT